MKHETRKVAHVQGTLDSDDILGLLEDRFEKIDLNTLKIWFEVPGGGDYSSTQIEDPIIHFSFETGYD